MCEMKRVQVGWIVALVLTVGCEEAEPPTQRGARSEVTPAKRPSTEVGSIPPTKPVELPPDRPLAKSAVPDPVWHELALNAALKKAGDDKKLVMIDFSTTNCTWCKYLDETTWKDAKVQNWLRTNTVAIKIDGSKEPALTAHYGIDVFPTLIFLKPDGTFAGRIRGYRNADVFLRTAGSIAARN
jgi:hypothetical protein